MSVDPRWIDKVIAQSTTEEPAVTILVKSLLKLSLINEIRVNLLD